MFIFVSQPERNSPSFSLSFPGAEGEQHRGIPLTKHPNPSPLTINPLPLCSHLKTHTMKKVPFPTIKEENPRREKKTKKEKKNPTSSGQRLTGRKCAIVCERACAEVDAVTPGKV